MSYECYSLNHSHPNEESLHNSLLLNAPTYETIDIISDA